MTRFERYDKELDRLARVLRSGGPKTARQLGAKLRCTRATVYNRLDGLRRRGYALRVRYVDFGRPGPRSSAYSLD